MKENNLILDKTFSFGLRIIKLHLHLKKSNVERALSLQVLRSGTSIGACRRGNRWFFQKRF